MRKLLVLVLAALVAAGVMSPAQASTRKYSVSVSLLAYERHDADRTHSSAYYTTSNVIDVSNDHEADFVSVRGKVTGGPVKGRTVSIYGTNTNGDGVRRKIGTAALSSSGRYSFRYHPPVGGRWTFMAYKTAAGSYRADSASRSIDAFQFAYLWEFYDPADSTPAGTPLVGRLEKSDEPDVREFVNGKRWGSELFVEGGATAVFDIRGYRCKKMMIEYGVSDQSKATTGTIRVFQSTLTRMQATMSKGQDPVEETTAEKNSLNKDSEGRFHDWVLRIAVAPSPVDPDAPVDPSYPATEHDIRFIVGNAKVFCTFPSVNITS